MLLKERIMFLCTSECLSMQYNMVHAVHNLECIRQSNTEQTQGLCQMRQRTCFESPKMYQASAGLPYVGVTLVTGLT